MFKMLSYNFSLPDFYGRFNICPHKCKPHQLAAPLFQCEKFHVQFSDQPQIGRIHQAQNTMLTSLC
jgi:hypothetical protein